MSSRRTGIWLMRLGVLAALTLIVVVILWVVVLPRVLENKILAALHGRGLAGATVRLRSVSLSKAALENLTFAPGYGFRISEIEVHYSLGSLRHKRVEKIVLSGVEAQLRVENGAVDFGPFGGGQNEGRAEGAGRGGVTLPFERTELQDATLHVSLEGRDLKIPVTAVIEAAGGDSASVEIEATLEEASIFLGATVDINTFGGAGDFQVDRLNTDLLQQLGGRYVAGRALRSEGYLNVAGRVSLQDDHWVVEAGITEERLALRARAPGPGSVLTVSALRGDVAYDSKGGVTFNLASRLNGTPLTLSGTLDPGSLDGTCDVAVDEAGAEILKELLSPYLPALPFRPSGRLTVAGTLTSKDGRVSADLTLDGKQLSLESEVSGHRLRVSNPVLDADLGFAYGAEGMGDVEGTLDLRGVRAADESLNLAVGEVLCRVPFSRKGKRIEKGTFTLKKIRIDEHEIPVVSGTLWRTEHRTGFTISGNLLPEAALNASGRFDLSHKPPSGELTAHIPRFALESGETVVRRFPALAADEIGGSFAVDAHVRLQGGRVVPSVRVGVDDAFWKRAASKARVEGVSGTLTLNGFKPLMTDGDQHFTLSSVKSGSFVGTDVVVVFQPREDESILVKSVECTWVDGKLWSDSIVVRPKRSTVSCDFHAERLSLQAILDFLDYDGVKGQGIVYGRLPVSVDWGERTEISFGDGFLEARPEKGRLQLSKKTAMTILGMTRDIDPKTADKHEMAKVLMLKALQDMEYSKLSMTFKDEGDAGWITRVQIQGHGPVGDKENRVPIGGLDINISNLDDLLNNVVLPGLESRKVKLD